MRGILFGFGIDTQARDRAGGLKSDMWFIRVVRGAEVAIASIFGQ